MKMSDLEPIKNVFVESTSIARGKAKALRDNPQFYYETAQTFVPLRSKKGRGRKVKLYKIIMKKRRRKT